MTAVLRPAPYHLGKFVSNGAGAITFQHAQDLIGSLPHLYSSVKNYDFPAITGSAISSGTLTAANQATMTFTAANPCPYGVNGADALHYLYVSAGTGTAEAVLITGGTAVEGGTSGTLTFTPANNHSGAWTIQSASSGIKECDISQGATKTMFCKNGTYNLRASLTLQAGSSLIGESVSGTSIVQAFATGHGITLPAYAGDVELGNFNITASVAVNAGYHLINCVTTRPHLHDILAASGWGMILLDYCSQAFLSNVLVTIYTRGLTVGGAAGASAPVVTNFIASTATANAVSVNIVNGLINLTNFDIQHSTSSGTDYHFYSAPTAGITTGESTVSNGVMDGGRGACINLSTAGGGNSYGWQFNNIQMLGGNNPDHMGISLGGTVLAVNFNNIQMRGVGVTLGAVQVGGGCKTVTFEGCWIGDFTAATVAVYLGVGAAACPGCAFRDCTIGYTSSGAQDANCTTAIDLRNVDHTDLIITGNHLYGSAGKYTQVGATKTRWKIANNTPETVSLASAATLAFGLYDDGQVVTLTGNTAVATAVTGIRNGQTGYFIAGDAAGVAFGATATVLKAFTVLQNIPAPFIVVGGQLVGVAYVS